MSFRIVKHEKSTWCKNRAKKKQARVLIGVGRHEFNLVFYFFVKAKVALEHFTEYIETKSILSYTQRKKQKLKNNDLE